MAKAKEFENILGECLDRLMKGETIEVCLARYPRYAAALEPLLKTALDAKQAALVKPRPEFRQRAGNEFQAAIHDLPAKKGWGGFNWQARWMVPVAVVLALLIGGAGTVVAATNALPGSPLYAVKMATESVQLAFNFSQQGKTELYARFVDYRVEEIVRMAENGDSARVEQTTSRMNDQLLAMADLNQTQGEKAATFSLMGTNGGTQAPSLTVPATTAPAPTVTLTQTYSTDNNTVINNVPAPLITQASNPESRNGAADTGALTDKEKLLQRLQQDMERNLQILKDQLAKAPEALKPALQKAIDVVESGYQQAIANLG